LLEPDGEHLIELMRDAALDRDSGKRMGAAGTAYVAENFTWERVTDRLLEVLFG
jgi:glycosyltransferase involved in cell wall biosynthesis